jgi:exonuclease III
MSVNFLIKRTRNSEKENVLNPGTWNVRTLLQAGKMKELAEEFSKFNFDIVALQELRWKDTGKIKKKEYSLFYSGIPNKADQRGTGFWINKEMRNKILGFEPICDRICKLRLKGKFNNLTLISVYAPTEGSKEEKVEVFYNSLERTCESINNYDTLIILGDFNAKIGKEDFVKIVTDKHSLHDNTSPNDLRLCQLVESMDLRIMSTSFPHKNIHKRI